MSSFKALAGAFLLAGFACNSQAAVYQVTGGLHSLDYYSPVGLVEMSLDPGTVALQGLWNIDVLSGAFSAQYDVAPYTVVVDLDSFGVTGQIRDYSPHDVVTIGTGNATLTYDAQTRTLSLVSGNLIIAGEPRVCTATGWLTCSTSGPTVDSENLELSLIFDADLKSFSGTGTHISWQSDGTSMSSQFFFNGADVPLPASFWLFGAGLSLLLPAIRRGR